MVFFSATLHSLQPSPACDLWKFSAHSSPGLKLCLPRAVPCCTWAASRLHQSGDTRGLEPAGHGATGTNADTDTVVQTRIGSHSYGATQPQALQAASWAPGGPMGMGSSPEASRLKTKEGPCFQPKSEGGRRPVCRLRTQAEATSALGLLVASGWWAAGLGATLRGRAISLLGLRIQMLIPSETPSRTHPESCLPLILVAPAK